MTFPLSCVNREVIVTAVPVPRAPSPNGGDTNDVPVMLTDPDVFDCCVCNDTLSIPVYQCINGHIICSPCCSKLGQKCFLCSMFIGDNRCRAIEAVLASMQTACSNARYGCNAVVRYSEKREHEKTCAFVPCLCPGPRCNWISNSNKLGQHFSEKHSFKRIPFKYGVFFDVSLRHNKRTRILQALSDGKLFVISNQMRETENSLFLCHIGPNSLVPQFHYEVKTKSDGAVLLPRTSVESTQGGKFVFPSAPLRFFYIPCEMFSIFGRIKLQFRITTTEHLSRWGRKASRLLLDEVEFVGAVIDLEDDVLVGVVVNMLVGGEEDVQDGQDLITNSCVPIKSLFLRSFCAILTKRSASVHVALHSSCVSE
ncbi:E3 ubiquitin-protein ligase SINA 10 [Spatholobus suberectus]|nr:E3 ubiquitin-protein ligase SINA 10 [Spatholobus suberectus]